MQSKKILSVVWNLERKDFKLYDSYEVYELHFNFFIVSRHLLRCLCLVAKPINLEKTYDISDSRSDNFLSIDSFFFSSFVLIAITDNISESAFDNWKFETFVYLQQMNHYDDAGC